MGLSRAVALGDYSSIFSRSAKAIEHLPGGPRHLADNLFSVAFVAEERRHDTDHVRTAFDKDDAGIVAHGFQRTRLVGNLEIGGQVARGEPRYAWSKSAHDIAIRNEIGGLYRVQIGEFKFSLLGLEVKIGQNCDLDGTGLGEDFVFMEEIALAPSRALRLGSELQ